MILKNITTRKAALRSGLMFWITIELEDDDRHIHRCVVDLEKGMESKDVIEKIQELAEQVETTVEIRTRRP